MSEKQSSHREKMINGELYLGIGEELTRLRQRAKKLCHQYNLLDPDDFEQRKAVLQELFGECSSLLVEQPFYCDYGSNIRVGKSFYANHGCVILDCAPVTIGDNVFFAPNVNVYTAGHPVNAPLRNTEYEYAIPVTIGSSVWIGGNTVINPGVTIGDNVVIGSGSVVTKDIPSGVVAAGNPCRVLRKIDERDTEYYFKNRRIPDELKHLTVSAETEER